MRNIPGRVKTATDKNIAIQQIENMIDDIEFENYREHRRRIAGDAYGLTELICGQINMAIRAEIRTTLRTRKGQNSDLL